MAKLKFEICEAEGFKCAWALAIYKKTKCEPIFNKPRYSSTEQMGSTSQQTTSLHGCLYEIVDDDIVEQMEYEGEDIRKLNHLILHIVWCSGWDYAITVDVCQQKT